MSQNQGDKREPIKSRMKIEKETEEVRENGSQDRKEEEAVVEARRGEVGGPRDDQGERGGYKKVSFVVITHPAALLNPVIVIKSSIGASGQWWSGTVHSSQLYHGAGKHTPFFLLVSSMVVGRDELNGLRAGEEKWEMLWKAFVV